MTVTGFILWFKTEWLMYFPMWTYDVARAIHFYEAILATLTIIVWHFYSVVWNPDSLSNELGLDHRRSYRT